MRRQFIVRWSALFAAITLVMTTGLATTSAPAGAAAGPACTFGGAVLGPIVPNVSAGTKVPINCTGLAASHPYLLLEASLTVAIDPAAQPLLTGNVTSLAGLLALIAALPEINATSEAFPTSDSSGNLSTSYTVPSTEPLAANAHCPPSYVEFNSGLIGCAVAMLDLTSFKPVPAGSFVIQYKGEPTLPPQPTLALALTKAKPGQSVSVSDAPFTKKYWWLSTLAALGALLGGGSGGGGPTVSVYVGNRPATSNVTVAPATYVNGTFTPPKLAGSFTVPSVSPGTHKVTITLSASLLGFLLSNLATKSLDVT